MKPVVITGPPGSGKTSLVLALQAKGFAVFHEISREIIDRELRNEGDRLPWLNHQAFHEEVLLERKKQLQQALHLPGPVFMDRGIPDGFGYLLAEGISISKQILGTINSLPYHSKVFFTPPWKEIFEQDAQRKEVFEQALAIHKGLLEIYTKLDFEIVELPFGSINERVARLLSVLSTDNS